VNRDQSMTHIHGERSFRHADEEDDMRCRSRGNSQEPPCHVLGEAVTCGGDNLSDAVGHGLLAAGSLSTSTRTDIRSWITYSPSV